MVGQAELSQILRREWCSVLGVDQAGAGDEFFGLGGDSLLAIELATRFEEAAGLEFPLESLFMEGTLGALEAAVTRAADA